MSLSNDRTRRSGEEGGDRLDLDELVVVAQGGDPEQGAGNVVIAEGVAHDLPRRHQVGPLG